MSMNVQPVGTPAAAQAAQAAQAATAATAAQTASRGATVAPNAIGNALGGRGASAAANTATTATTAAATATATKTSFFTKIKNSKFGQGLGNAFSKVKSGFGKVFKSKGGKIGLGIAAAAALIAAGKFIYDKLTKPKDPVESTEPVAPVVVPEQEEATEPVAPVVVPEQEEATEPVVPGVVPEQEEETTEPETPVAPIPLSWQGFLDSEKDMVCRDASGKTKNIQGKIGNLPETFTKAPDKFTITDSSSGQDHVYSYVKIGYDNDERPIYKCTDMNGREMQSNQYTLEWVNDTQPELVQLSHQDNYGIGLKFKK